MAEVIGLVAAAAQLIQIFNGGRERLQKASEKLEAFENARSSSVTQIEDLRVVYTNLAMMIGKYDRHVAEHMSTIDREGMKQLVLQMNSHIEKSEVIIADLRRVMRSGSNKKEMDRLRQDLSQKVSVFTSFQNSLTSHVVFENFRRQSEGTSKSAYDSQSAGKSELKRVSTGGSSISSSSSKGKAPEVLARRDTSMSDRTLGRVSTMGSAITRVATSPSVGSSGSSSNSTQTVSYIQSPQLKAAVEERNMTMVRQLINNGKSYTEIESRKASALLLACRFRKTELVRELLLSKASVDIYDEDGLGAIHASIGRSEIIEAHAKEGVNILKLLVQSRASIIRAREDARERRQPLHFCAVTGNFYAAHYLLSQDPQMVDFTDAYKKTALYHACAQPSPNEKLVRLLLDKGATFGTKDRPRMGIHPRNLTIRKMLDNAEKRRSLTG